MTGEPNEIIAPPHDLGEERAALPRDAQRHLLPRQVEEIAEFDAGALVGDVADDALAAHARLADLRDAAVNHFVARVLASVPHRCLPIKRETFTPLFRAEKAVAGKMRR